MAFLITSIQFFSVFLVHSFRASLYNFENNQQDALYRFIYYSKSALHVLGDVFDHHQEYLPTFTVSGSVNTFAAIVDLSRFNNSCLRLLKISNDNNK
jgi:hypothetical protein